MFMIVLSSYSQSNMKHKFTNHLANESSPYLLQHSHNPVNWYPWSDKALIEAKKENKLLIISIGYAACHWCHVMEEQSFEDLEVAELMNKNFISIKVDREERPDIDQIYMDACHLMSGRGGWPLNAIALPDGRPVYAGTYFPKDKWIELLKQLQNIWEKQPERLISQAENITQGLNELNTINISDKSAIINNDIVHLAFSKMSQNFDFKYGGHGQAPKFPMPSEWNFVMNYSYFSENKTAINALQITLDEMAKGGIYDHLGGGFSRYSTDKYWKVPHFEKMLYDNAQLISLYSKAYQYLKDDFYKKIIVESIEFVERELTHENGGFYSSLDADSEGEEGKYYVWTAENIDDILQDQSTVFMNFYQITVEGNWEHGNNILILRNKEEEYAIENKLDLNSFQTNLKSSRQKLWQKREERIRPATDDKILCSWNALMLSAYIDAYRAIGDKSYLEKAISSANFIQTNFLKEDYRLDRNFKNNRSTINAFLDDYAFVIKAYLDLYQSSFDVKYLLLAKNLTEYVFEHFKDTGSVYFYYTSDLDPALVSRSFELSDNVIPASNSQMAHNLFVLGKILDIEQYINHSKLMLIGQLEGIKSQASFYSNWANLLLKFTEGIYEIVIIGENYKEIADSFKTAYLPNIIMVASPNESKELPLTKYRAVNGKTLIYVCQNNVCQLPVETVEEAIDQIE